MEISRNAPTAKGPAETFTGDVWVIPITRGLPPSQLNVAAVGFSRVVVRRAGATFRTRRRPPTLRRSFRRRCGR